jgi:hypothetical protein
VIAYISDISKFYPISSKLVVKMASMAASESLLNDCINEEFTPQWDSLKNGQEGGEEIEEQKEEGVATTLAERVMFSSPPSSGDIETSPPGSNNKPPQPKVNPKKRVNVAVTIISVSGVHIQDCSKQKKNFRKKSSRYRELENTPSTTIGASFSRKGEKKDASHASSLPVQFHGASGTSPGIIHWPEDDEPASYHFQRDWEEQGNLTAGKSAPDPCIIHLGIERSGRKFNLGSAKVLGVKLGEFVGNIPITNELPTGKQTKIGKGKKVKMIKLKGESVKCGVEQNALLRVKVNVSEPVEVVPETEEGVVLTSSVRQYTMPQSPSRVRSIRQSFSKGTDCLSKSTSQATDSQATDFLSQSTDVTSNLSGESNESSQSSQKTLERGVEIHFNATEYQPLPEQTSPTMITSKEAKKSSKAQAEEDEYSRSGQFSMVSSFSDDNTYLDDYGKKITWRRLLMCQIPVCGMMRSECADMRGGTSRIETFDDDGTHNTLQDLSRSSSYVPW